MAEVKLNQRIKMQLDELRSLFTNGHTPIMFILDDVLFDVDEVIKLTDARERVIVGRILPTSDVFQQGVFQIQIRLSSIYPLNPPNVHFITPIYHPNVGQNGEFHHEFLQKTARWSNTASLVDVVRTVFDRINDPDVDCSINQEVADEYVQNRTEFNRKALEMVQKHSLPRN